MNKDAYFCDLDDVEALINALLALVPIGTAKAAQRDRQAAEELAWSARATLHCMRRDYEIVEQ